MGSLVANIIKAGVIQSQDGSSWWDLESGEVVFRAYATSKEVIEVSGGRYKEIVSLNGLKSNVIYGGMKLRILNK